MDIVSRKEYATKNVCDRNTILTFECIVCSMLLGRLPEKYLKGNIEICCALRSCGTFRPVHLDLSEYLSLRTHNTQVCTRMRSTIRYEFISFTFFCHALPAGRLSVTVRFIVPTPTCLHIILYSITRSLGLQLGVPIVHEKVDFSPYRVACNCSNQ